MVITRYARYAGELVKTYPVRNIPNPKHTQFVTNTGRYVLEGTFSYGYILTKIWVCFDQNWVRFGKVRFGLGKCFAYMASCCILKYWVITYIHALFLFACWSFMHN